MENQNLEMKSVHCTFDGMQMAAMHIIQTVSSTTNLPPFVNSLESRENIYPGIDKANTTASVANECHQ